MVARYLDLSSFFFTKNHNFVETNALQQFYNNQVESSKNKSTAPSIGNAELFSMVPILVSTVLFSSKYEYRGTFGKYPTYLWKLDTGTLAAP